jgi:GT2 family glycosyltransferase
MDKADEIISIGMPLLNSMMHMQASFSIVNMILTSKDLNIDFLVTNNTQIQTARREIVESAQATHASYLLFVDSDMSFKGDTLKRLLAHKKDVIGVHYNQRGLPLMTTVRVKDKNTGLYRVPAVHEMVYDKPFKCDAVGAGCMLIDMKVFNKIEKPWFLYVDNEKFPMGEDVWFCQQVKKAGFDVWCDPTIKVEHIGEYSY